MEKGCISNCLACGKCAGKNLPILEEFQLYMAERTAQEGYGIAVDIGTTTVVLVLLELRHGTPAARHSFPNPQRVFGTDVISRIHAANNGKGEELRRLITAALVSGFSALLDTCKEARGKVRELIIAGNTAMIHLLLGLSCEALGVYPFKPAFTLRESYSFAELFGEGEPGCPVTIIPWLAAFVGGDIAAGLLCAEKAKHSRYMLIDLGTNGELALCRGDKIWVTSTAAGPAFEGGSHPGGASAVLEDLARLRGEGYIDESGLLTEGAPPLFSQKEIRDLQLAKAALRAGIEILLETAGVGEEELEAVFLAGGIGRAIRPESAARTGLLPPGLSPLAQAAGNSSLGGAVLLLLCPEERDKLRTMAALTEEINLSAHPRFNDLFVDYMGFDEE